MDVDSIMEPDSVELGRFKNPWDLSTMRTFDRSTEQMAQEYRARAKSAINHMSAATDRTRSAATDLIERFDDEQGNLSRLAVGLSDPTYLRAWSKMARNPQSATLEDDERRAIARVETLARAMSLTDTAGGYLVPFQLDPTVILTSAGSYNEIRRMARQVVATGDVWHGVSAGAVSWGYRAEAAEAGDDAPTFVQPTVPVYTADGFVPISVEALADAANVTSEVGTLLAQGKEDLEAQAFATGTGSGQPTGIVTALVASSPTVIVPSAGANVFAAADVYAVHDNLPARYRGRPGMGWLANNLIYSAVRQFDDEGGGDLWARIGENRPNELVGKPVMEAEAMDGTYGSGENYVLIGGDWYNYVIADRIGTTVEFIPHLFGANQRPTGQRGWWAYVRHGADSVNDGAFRMLNIT
jgi:HK97 family phage major capsid protein